MAKEDPLHDLHNAVDKASRALTLAFGDLETSDIVFAQLLAASAYIQQAHSLLEVEDNGND